jgi:hypothetical protein
MTLSPLRERIRGEGDLISREGKRERGLFQRGLRIEYRNERISLACCGELQSKKGNIAVQRAFSGER